MTKSPCSFAHRYHQHRPHHIYNFFLDSITHMPTPSRCSFLVFQNGADAVAERQPCGENDPPMPKRSIAICPQYARTYGREKPLEMRISVVRSMRTSCADSVGSVVIPWGEFTMGVIILLVVLPFGLSIIPQQPQKTVERKLRYCLINRLKYQSHAWGSSHCLYLSVLSAIKVELRTTFNPIAIAGHSSLSNKSGASFVLKLVWTRVFGARDGWVTSTVYSRDCC